MVPTMVLRAALVAGVLALAGGGLWWSQQRGAPGPAEQAAAAVRQQIQELEAQPQALPSTGTARALPDLVTTGQSGDGVKATVLYWDNLLPPEALAAGVSEAPAETPPPSHDGTLKAAQPRGSIAETGVVKRYEGKRVKLPGFMVPLDFDNAEVREFLFVPWMGACLHVPPPPPNQVVHVRSDRPVRVRDIAEPLAVTGLLMTQASSTDLADAGYSLVLESVEPFDDADFPDLARQ